MGTVTALPLPDPEPDDRGKKKAKGRRKVNGEGNIRLRSDGRWEGRAYVLTTDGREVRRSVYGKTWDEVNDELTKLQADRIAGKRVTSSKLTVGEYLEYWLDEIVRPRVRDTTFEGYEWVVRKYLIPLFGRKRLTQLQASDIRRAFYALRSTCQCCKQGKDRARADLAAKARAAGRKPKTDAKCCAKTPKECCEDFVSEGTIMIFHRRLRTALQDAVTEERILTGNVAKNLKLRFPRYRPKFKAWSEAEARRFLDAVRDDRLEAVFTVALLLGLRRGEALGLEWRHVDLDQGIIEVEQSLARVNGGLRLGPVKSDGSAAFVPVPDVCIDTLKRHRDRQNCERESAGRKWKRTDLVFTTPIGTPIDPRNAVRRFAELCAKAGVRRIRFHDLRHSCGTMLYQMGVPIEHIQDILRHATPVITKTLYVDSTDKVQRAAMDQLGARFSKPKE